MTWLTKLLDETHVCVCYKLSSTIIWFKYKAISLSYLISQQEKLQSLININPLSSSDWLHLKIEYCRQIDLANSVVSGKIRWKETDANDRKIHKGEARKQSTKAGTSIKNPLAKYTIPIDPSRYLLSIVLIILKAYSPHIKDRRILVIDRNRWNLQ